MIANDSAKRLAIVEKEIAGLKEHDALEAEVPQAGGGVWQEWRCSGTTWTASCTVPAVLPREDRAALEASVAHLGRDSAKAIIKLVAQKLFTGLSSPGRWCVLRSTACV